MSKYRQDTNVEHEAQKSKVLGVVEFPAAITFVPEALGRTYMIRVNESSMKLELPSAVTGERSLRSPRPSVSDLNARAYRGWGSVIKWKAATNEILSASVTAAAIEGVIAAAEDNADAAHSFGDQFATWFRLLETWTLLWTGHSLSSQITSEAPTLSLMFEHGSGSGYHPPIMVQIPSDDGITSTTFQAACDRASDGDLPPLPWQLLVKARNGEDRRLSLVDAATAAEVSIEKRITDELERRGMSAHEADAVLRPATGIVDKLRLLEALVPRPSAQSSLLARVADQVARPRNAAVHAAHAPDGAVLERALSTAEILIERYWPMPRPASF